MTSKYFFLECGGEKVVKNNSYRELYFCRSINFEIKIMFDFFKKIAFNMDI